jgi:hypothetical protein
MMALGGLRRIGWGPIHLIADKDDSRKPLFTLSDAYGLGPVLSADSSPEKRFQPSILLHVWMNIHSS